MSIEQMLEQLAAPPAPASEVVALERATVENILAELEEKNPLRLDVAYLRRVLAEPKFELWAIHSVGSGEVYPCLNKEAAEEQAQALRDMGEQMKAERIAKGESVEMWSAWVTNVIPSPWEPSEHFEIMAKEWQDDAENVREHYATLTTGHAQLQADHEQVSNNRDMWKGQVERQAEELTKLRTEREELLTSLQFMMSWRVAKAPKKVVAFVDGVIAKAKGEQS